MGLRASLAAAALGLLPMVPALAQPASPPPIGSIDFYGLRTLSEEDARAALPFKEGDPLPAATSREPLQAEMAAALGVAHVELSGVCCSEAGLFQIYVGIDEAGGAAPAWRAPPTSEARLPGEVLQAYEALSARLMQDVLSGQANEDVSQGHGLSENPETRALQESFVDLAERHRGVLASVLAESADAHHRAAAAQVLAYAKDKAAVVDDLTSAALDPDEGVRNNATRALSIMALYAIDTPESGVRIDPAPFVGMLDSIVWTDRNKGLFLIEALTTNRDPELLAQLRERALPDLAEMCGWSSWGHARPACTILRRALGLPEDGAPESRQETLAAAEAAGAPRAGALRRP